VDFSKFSFDQRLLTGIRDCGYTTPTPIQEQAIIPILDGKDVLGLAQTGTGKTAAFALPILQRLLAADRSKRGPIRVLVLSPTRELTLQIHESFIALGKQTGIRSTTVFGGVGETPQIKAAASATVLVACPGRLLDLLNRGLIKLDHVETLVLDEADRMFDMGFLPDVRRILAKLSVKRQNLLFSATMPTEIRAMADQILVKPTVVQIGLVAPAETVSHALYPVAASQKISLLESFLRHSPHESVLIFTRTKHRAKNLARKLELSGWLATSLQGNLSQTRRQEALDGFRSGKYQIMVATDIAARGIDCARISHVINFDLPDTAENYTHRIGRTGRAKQQGYAVTLVSREDAAQVRAIERVLGAKIKQLFLEGFAYHESPETELNAGALDHSRQAPPRPQGGRRTQPGRGTTQQKPAGAPRHAGTPKPQGRKEQLPRG